MRKTILLALVSFFCAVTNAQTPVVMASQPGLTYQEDFSDIANWADNFASGIGASRFASVAAMGSGAIPNATRTTVSSAFFQPTEFISGVQKGTIQLMPTQSIVLLSTGTTDNTSSVAFDFFMDFSAVNAGSLSFNWQSINNASGNRNGSLRVYTSTDGINFTELAAASVLNFSNGTVSSGIVSNIVLPSSFNNSATARLRFYYHNGTGGTTGSRPKISIDNLVVTATTTVACTTPVAQPTSLNLSGITTNSINGNFAAANPLANEYLVLASTSPASISIPVDGVVYNAGDNLGDASVIARSTSTNFSATGLTPSTTYYFYVYSLNSACANGPKYLMNAPLTANATTTTGIANCTSPASQPVNLSLFNETTHSIQGSFVATAASHYLVVSSTSSTLNASPANGVLYNSGDVLGNGTIVRFSEASNFTAGSLAAGTNYYFFVFAANYFTCAGGPAYNINAPVSSNKSTLALPTCSVPIAQPTGLNLSSSATNVVGSFTASSSADAYLVVRSTSPTLLASPVDNVNYPVGSVFGGGTVVSNDAAPGFSSSNLSPNTAYYFFIFAMRSDCINGPKYLSAAPLQGNTTTLNLVVNNFYFGTWHAHSDYSDGNQDNPGFTPTDDYNFALTAQCMDFLGISEHNHFSSPNNPGTLLSSYHAGVTEAELFNQWHPNFLALYGMEWGVISGGGHVLVYGNGMNNLIGWETNVGGTSGPNYDVYVAKNDYTGTNGLFKTINDFAAFNTFGSLAHPSQNDFGNLANVPYDAAADDAICATAVESGPATSLNVTYSNPGSSMGYLWYYQTLLAKGYHLGPVVDHDNHNTTFGKTTYSRTAIIAPALDKAAIFTAMRNMNFYATRDCDTKVDFSINNRIMGSIFTDRNAPVVNVHLTDSTNNLSGAVIRLMFGVPGSGALPVKIDSAVGNTLSFTDTSLHNFQTGYYYVDVANGNSRVITSPIWYTRADGVVPVAFIQFSVSRQNDFALLHWQTGQEINSSHFRIERSADGMHWSAIGMLAAAGFSNSRQDYYFTDRNMMVGKNFYRIVQADQNNHVNYTDIKMIMVDSQFLVTLAPNPAHDYVFINFNEATGRQHKIEIVNSFGQIVRKMYTMQPSTKIGLQQMTTGLYVVRVDGSVQAGKLLVR